MKLVKPLFFFVSAILLTLACGVGDDLSPTLPVNTAVDTPTVRSSVPTRHVQTATPSPNFFSPISQASPFPAWVTDFSDPILESLAGQQPVFEDAFSPICIDEYKEWKVCSTPEQRILSLSNLALATARPTLDLQPDLQNGYSLLNKGWFYIVPDSSRNPFYAHIDNETLLLKLPEGKEKRDLWVYNPKLNLKNFVLNFDFQFEETQPGDKVRFQFSQAANQSMALDLSKSQTWTMHWGSHSNWQSITGAFSYFPPERITMLIIVQGKECAVYLNDAPLTYLNNCRTSPTAYASPRAVTFHLLSEPGHVAAVTIDNVKLWDLDKITSAAKP